jgi:hypothetical protein
LKSTFPFRFAAPLAVAVALCGGVGLAQTTFPPVGNVCAGGHLFICAPASKCCVSTDPADDHFCQQVAGDATTPMSWNSYSLDGSCVYGVYPEHVLCQDQGRFGTCELSSFTFEAHACSEAEQVSCPGPTCGTYFASTYCKLDDVVDADEPPSTPPADPYPALHPKDTVFMGSALNGQGTCLYRSAGPITLMVLIDRVVGDTDPQGMLLDPSTLVANGIVTSSALLTLPAWDVDYSASVQNYAPERDRITINGQDIGPGGGKTYLNGSDKTWTLNKYSVPIEVLHFGTRVPGHASIPGVNLINISIDEANASGGKEPWCTSADWAALSFDALAPVVMVHGNNSSGAFFTDFDFVRPFKDQKFPYDNSIFMPTDYIWVHSQELKALIPDVAREFGSRHVHLVVHSKGGLDSRDFLAWTIPPNFGVFSLISLSTPHHGSVGADYQLDSVGANPFFSDSFWRTVMSKAVPPDHGTENLRVSYVRQFNIANDPLLPTQFTVDEVTDPVSYLAISADANLDGSSIAGVPTITLDEVQGTPIPKVPVIAGTAGTILYNTLYSVAETRLCTKSVGGRSVKAVCETATESGQVNDIAVTRTSANHPRFVEIAFVKANHATIARPDVGQIVIQAIKAIQPLQEPQ